MVTREQRLVLGEVAALYDRARPTYPAELVDTVVALIGGTGVTETVFTIPGMGRLTVDAILRRDYPVIQGLVLVFSFVYVLVNLAVDLIYTLVDPRIRY